MVDRPTIKASVKIPFLCEKCFSPVLPRPDLTQEPIHKRTKPTPKDPEGVISLVLFPLTMQDKLCYYHTKRDMGLITGDVQSRLW